MQGRSGAKIIGPIFDSLPFFTLSTGPANKVRFSFLSDNFELPACQIRKEQIFYLLNRLCRQSILTLPTDRFKSRLIGSQTVSFFFSLNSFIETHGALLSHRANYKTIQSISYITKVSSKMT